MGFDLRWNNLIYMGYTKVRIFIRYTTFYENRTDSIFPGNFNSKLSDS